MINKQTLAIAMVLGAANAVGAFDTGHHFDVTRSVLEHQGFAADPVSVCQVTNWLVDYYSSSPTAPGDVKREVRKLHFDNLYVNKDTTWYWHNLLLNAKAATEKSAANNQPLRQLAVMGIVFHAVQDFYSHSNWVETHPRSPNGPYRSETWTTHGAGNSVIRTGKYEPYPSPPPRGTPEHGGYTGNGLNKDSHVRSNWEQAQVFAFVECNQLAAAMKVWAEAKRSGFWKQCRTLTLANADRRALASDAEAARDISMYISLAGADGHWKGNLSGDLTQFQTAAAAFVTSSNSRFVRYFRNDKLHAELSQRLYTPPPNQPAPTVPAVSNAALHVIAVRVTKIEEDKVGFTERKIDVGGEADFYAWITVQGRRQLERIIHDDKSVANPWYALEFVAAASDIPVKIEVWDQDGGIRGGDDHCDIRPGAGRDIQFNVAVDATLSGDVSGQFNSAASTFQRKGDQDDRAIITAYVTRTPIQ